VEEETGPRLLGLAADAVHKGDRLLKGTQVYSSSNLKTSAEHLLE